MEDTKIKSFSFDQLKAQCENYLDVIDAMIEVNGQDIADYNTLSAAVGNEALLGDQILSNQEHCLAAEENARRKAENYRSMAATVASASQGLSSMADVYWEIAKYWNEMAELYREWYEEWKEKENRYDDIEAATSGLFAGSSAIRAVLNSMLEGLQGSFNINTGQYSPDVIAVQKQQLDCIKQGDVDTAAGIQALDEYMIESGRFNPQERVAVIKKIMSLASEKLRTIQNIPSEEERKTYADELAEMYSKPDWINHVMQTDGISGQEQYMNKRIQNLNVPWNQEKVNQLWEASEQIYDEYGIDIDPRFLLAIIIQEGTGSFNTSSTNLAADGQHGVETDYAKDLMKANSLIFGKILGYIYYGEEFKEAAKENAGLLENSSGNIFTYCNWYTPIVDIGEDELDYGVYANHNIWGSNVESIYEKLTYEGAGEDYTEYISDIDRSVVEEITGWKKMPECTFKLKQEGEDAQGKYNNTWTIVGEKEE